MTCLKFALLAALIRGRDVRTNCRPANARRTCSCADGSRHLFERSLAAGVQTTLR